MSKRCFLLVACLLWPLAGHAAGDSGRGEILYESRCGGCHALDADRVGPRHRGLLGRRAGSVTGFGYSEALAAANLVWDRESLDRWLRDPEATVPGQNMNLRVKAPEDRADIIAYLIRESGR